jgi:hypothetical protein
VPSNEFLLPSSDNCWGLIFIRPSRGTKRAPYLVAVDLVNPERNGIFDITRVENMERDEFERSGLHIRLSIDDNDQSNWESKIPNSEDYPKEFEGRIIHVNGQALPFWLRHTALYHDWMPEPCPATKKAHENADKARAEDPNREEIHYALVLPPGSVVDNQILSKHERKLPLGNILLDMDQKDQRNDAGMAIEGNIIYWEIAFVGGREIGEKKKVETQAEIRAKKKAMAKKGGR